ncbi:endonuclease/exonuclease/phosphatase family protein [Jiulongibacter sediminis]|uniref:endonuclease/exonuclease/phosphatase family protein n=1 Tax=Jiulongibacter sediminis TaxID=1605367 RepID=UPI0026EF18BE|nr:endonuclease/exonuclease/phosphatase family protein [Jiulongibacter sediminis]
MSIRFISFVLTLLSAPAFSQSEFNAMTFNIRYNNPGDGINQWDNRKHLVAQTIQYYEADFVGLQEATKVQVEYLANQLSEFEWKGVGRDDGKEGGEYSPLFFRKDKFELLNWKTLWLSETPGEPSKSWDAALPRIATFAWLKSKEDGRKILVINTHYDHMGVKARENSSALLIREINQIKEDLPVILMGDFNSTPEKKTIQTITEGGLFNTQYISKQPHYGPFYTFNGFKEKEQPDTNIDHIFVTPNIQVLKHASLSNTWEGRFASDHYAVIAKIKI